MQLPDNLQMKKLDAPNTKRRLTIHDSLLKNYSLQNKSSKQFAVCSKNGIKTGNTIVTFLLVSQK
jgi:hypothetical protein